MKQVNKRGLSRPAAVPATVFLFACAAVVAVSLLSSFTGCARDRKKNSEKKIVIGFSIATDTFIIERWNKDIKIFTGAARDRGADVIVQLSAGGTKEQIDQINFLLARHIDVLVVVAHDTEMLAGVVKKARDARIPVVAYDRLIMGVPIDAFVSFNNREVGRLFGEALMKAVPAGRYLIVNGSKRDNNSYEVNGGLHEVLAPRLNTGQIKIVQEIWLDEWSFDEALEKIGAVLERTTGIDAISCANDQIASAALQLLSEYRLAGKVAVVGQDADIGACQKIVEGTQLMTVYKPIGRLAERAAGIASRARSRDRQPLGDENPLLYGRTKSRIPRERRRNGYPGRFPLRRRRVPQP
jgi:D-xylose transport system substrate-binding protein